MFALSALTLLHARLPEKLVQCVSICAEEKAVRLAVLGSKGALTLRSICQQLHQGVFPVGSRVLPPPFPVPLPSLQPRAHPTMFYFDDDRSVQNERRRCGEEDFDSEEEEDYMQDRRRVSARSRPSEGFILGGWSDEEDNSSEADEAPSQLVPMKMGIAPIGKGRRKRTQSRSQKCTFYDFYSMREEQLGSGAYGSVCTCVQRSTGIEMAVKLVDKTKSSRARIKREVDTFKLCADNKNIVKLYDWFEDDDMYYMVFEKMHGGPLLKKIQENGCFTELEASRVTRDIASALKFLHDHGIAHRDVKPENILCTERDHVSPVKLCDLDLASKMVNMPPARFPSVASEPELASPVGSAEFMAPEVVDAFVGEDLKYDKRCDMWSLGVILYIMLCGYVPFFPEGCGSEHCGWDRGEHCEECRNDLFERIREGYFEMEGEEWDEVSDDAKDLIRHLLVIDARRRFTADQVLAHAWVTREAPSTYLQTPGNLLRSDSARNVQNMTEHFNMMQVAKFAGTALAETDESSSPSPSPPSGPPFILGALSYGDTSLVVPQMPTAYASPPSDTKHPSGGSLFACQQSVPRVDSHSEMRENPVPV